MTAYNNFTNQIGMKPLSNCLNKLLGKVMEILKLANILDSCLKSSD